MGGPHFQVFRIETPVDGLKAGVVRAHMATQAKRGSSPVCCCSKTSAWPSCSGTSARISNPNGSLASPRHELPGADPLELCGLPPAFNGLWSPTPWDDSCLFLLKD